MLQKFAGPFFAGAPVRPNMMNASVSDIDSLESVQRRFTKRLSGLHNLSYEARLKRLKLQSVELRRLLADIMWYYNLQDHFGAC